MAKKERDAKSEPTAERPAPAAAKQPVEGDQHDYSYTQNREVSWLRFDDRVLEESYDESVPLFERFKFVSIFSVEPRRVVHDPHRRPLTDLSP
jgi:polyphosphate kinase